MAVSSRFRVATVVAALALTVALLAGTTATAFTGPTGKLVAGAEERALRLHDLPPGYRIGDDSGCGPLGIEGAPPALANFVLENWPEGCGFQYEQLFRLPGAEPAPPLVESEVLALPSEQSSKAGFELLAGLIHDQTGKDAAKEILPPPAIGEVTRLFQTKSLVEGRPYRPSATVIWRQGTFVAELTVAGRSAAANERIALQLAQVQQARVLAPTPYTEAEQDDTEVALGNPKINFPIFWLGSTFEPGHGLASSKLEEVLLFSRSGEGPPGEKLALWYGGLNIDAWRPAGWRRFNRTVLGPLNQKWKCTKSTRLRLAHGHADVFAAYGRDFAVCPKRPPDRFYAIGHLGGMVVGVNLIYCTACMGPGSGPYNSLQAMKAVVRGLLRRPKPVF